MLVIKLDCHSRSVVFSQSPWRMNVWGAYKGRLVKTSYALTEQCGFAGECISSVFVCTSLRGWEGETDLETKRMSIEQSLLYLSIWIININLLVYHQPINLDLHSHTDTQPQAHLALLDRLIVWLYGSAEIRNESEWRRRRDRGKIFWLETNGWKIDGAISASVCFIYH